MTYSGIVRAFFIASSKYTIATVTLALAALGCQVMDFPDPAGGPAQALFEVPRPGAPPSEFYALPFPNDIRVDDVTGEIDLGDYKRPNALIHSYMDAIQQYTRGFSVAAASFVRFDAPIDPASLPQTPQEAVAEDAAVYLVNIDPASERHGERVPLRLRFETYAGEVIGENWLSALPYPGFVLAEQATHALVVTSRLRATDGSAVTASEDFLAVLGDDRSGPAADPAIVRARNIYAPLMTWLDQPGGDERADVVAASVFTTQDATSLLADVREVIWNQVPAPVARDLVRLADGVNYHWYDGLYDGPNFQRGESPFWRIEDGGDIVRDPDTGMPVVQRMEELRFSFTVPQGAMPAAGWPVVLYAHGTGGSYHSFRGVAARLADQGLAVISIDQVMHEPRVPAGSSPEILFFNFQNPLAARDNTLQGALDNFQLVRLVLGFEHTVMDQGPPQTIRFDPDRMYFFGHSQGGLTGPPFLIHEPLVKGAVLSGAGGLLYLSMILKTEPVDVAGLVGTIIRDYPLDEFNPVLAMLQMFIDRADPVVYGPLLVRRPMPGLAPKHIYQSEGFTDRYTPVASIEALATSIGGNLVAPVIGNVEGLTLLDRPVLSAPVTGNYQGTTSVLVQYEQLADSDGHFVVFDVGQARIQSSYFLGTLAETGAATLVDAP
jgi:dienelactone hydrolase